MRKKAFCPLQKIGIGLDLYEKGDCTVPETRHRQSSFLMDKKKFIYYNDG